MAVFRRARAEKRERAPKRERYEGPYNRRFFAATGFLVAVAVFGTMFAVVGGDNGGTAADGGTSSTVAGGGPDEEVPVPATTYPSLSLPQLQDGAAACPNAAAGPKDIPESAPAGVTWSLYRNRLVPFSKTVGPTTGKGDIARCYAHTPTGALIAAAQISARYNAGADWRAVMLALVVPGTDTDAAMVIRADKAAARETAEPPAEAPNSDRVLQLAGFKFVSYSDDAAVIQLVRSSIDGGQLVSALYTVRWFAGDWKLQVAANASEASMVQRETSLTGFVPWSPGEGQ